MQHADPEFEGKLQAYTQIVLHLLAKQGPVKFQDDIISNGYHPVVGDIFNNFFVKNNTPSY
ncbi:MAG: hypothetical protein ABIE43_02390 [Patescibacteria group bacterium]